MHSPTLPIFPQPSKQQLQDGMDITLTWSGLVWQRGGVPITSDLRRDLIVAYLTAADAWLAADPDWRWRTISNPTDPAVDPALVIGPVPIFCSARGLLRSTHTHSYSRDK